MLTHLGVRDFAIVDNLELALGSGMTVLTGETGAGKSLIVDALELAVGGRASADLVRAGAGAAEVNAVFEPNGAVSGWLVENALDDADGSCVLRRIVGADGRSRAFVNGRPVPVSQLRALGELLVDVHGQHAHQALLKPEAQRALLDDFGVPQELLEQVAALHATLRGLDAEIESLGESGDDPTARLDFLEHQIAELAGEPVEPAALEALDAEQRRLAHAADILDDLGAAREALDADDVGARGAVAAALRRVESAARHDPVLDGARDLLRQCEALLAEADTLLRRHGDAVDTDPQRLDVLERRLAAIHDLARKHRCPAHELHRRLASLREEHERLRGASARLDAIAGERARFLSRYREAAAALGRERAAAAVRLAEGADAVLATLGMAGAGIRFDLRHDAGAAPGPAGCDSVTLVASTNPGQPHLPLSRVASGGELSRIALAVHAVALARTGAATLVFDEVDAGIGGATAEIVGRRMRELGEQRQVLTVTHLPQVAALAHRHVAVRKRQDATGSRSAVEPLDDAGRERELARMLAGVDVTDKTLAHAREMLAAARAGRRRRPTRPAA